MRGKEEQQKPDEVRYFCNLNVKVLPGGIFGYNPRFRNRSLIDVMS